MKSYKPYSKLIVGLLSIVAIASCTTSNKFSMEENKKYFNNGQSSLRGQAFITSPFGSFHTCAFNKVYLFPNTSYYSFLVEKDKEGAKNIHIPKIAKSLVRDSICDNNGNYEIHNLPEGEWFLYSVIPYRHNNEDFAERLIKKVTTRDKTSDGVFLTRSDYLPPIVPVYDNKDIKVFDIYYPKVSIDGGECDINPPLLWPEICNQPELKGGFVKIGPYF